MSQLSVEKKFAILCEINRAQHFAWREAVTELCPDVDASAVVDKMWAITGVETARSYLKRFDKDGPLAKQLAESIVWSSQCMGEDATVEISDDGDVASVRHADCPWVHWHRKKDLVAEDQPGCDTWFRTMIDEVNGTLGTALRFETVESLPAEGSCCLRRIWTEKTES